MAYERQVWEAREGTNLTKFTKSSETSTEVVLTNAPDSITIAGTPFSADAMNNIEQGIEETRINEHLSYAFSDAIRAICQDADNFYLLDAGGYYIHQVAKATLVKTLFCTGLEPGLTDIVQTGGALYVTASTLGTIIKIPIASPTPEVFSTGHVNPAHLVVSGSYLYVTEGTSGRINRVALSTGARTEFLMLTGNLYAIATDNTYLYVSRPNSMCKIKISDATYVTLVTYADTYTGGAYCLTGAGLFILDTTTGSIIRIDTVTGKRQVNGSFGVAGMTSIILSTYDAWVYGVYGSNDTNSGLHMLHIDAGDRGVCSPSSICEIVMRGNTTLRAVQASTILLTGELTANCDLIVQSTARKYTIINNCTGAYHVHVKTAIFAGVYTAPTDTAEIYCNGDSIFLTRMSTPRTILLTKGTGQSIPSSTLTAITFSASGDALGEFSGGTFTAKNKCIVAVSAYENITGAGAVQTLEITAASHKHISVTSTEWASATCTFALNAGDTIVINAYSMGATPSVSAASFASIQIIG